MTRIEVGTRVSLDFHISQLDPSFIRDRLAYANKFRHSQIPSWFSCSKDGPGIPEPEPLTND